MSQKAPSAVPPGLHTLTAQLWFNGNGEDALAFYEKAFGAQIVGEVARGPEELGVMHAVLRLGDASFMLADAMPGGPEFGPDDTVTSSFWLYVPDCDRAFEVAADAGAEVIHGPTDMFWGDRVAKLRDPFGHLWTLATWQQQMTPQELKDGMERWLESMKQDA